MSASVANSSSAQLIKRRKARQLARRGGKDLSELEFTEQSTGVIVEPIVILIISLIYIGSVFLLHMLGRYFS